MSDAGAEGSPSLVRASALMSLGTVLSRITGLLRIIAITAALGIAEERLADTYNLANTVPNLIYELILGGILWSVFVPVIVEVLQKNDADAAGEAISAVINVSMVLLVGVTVIGVLAAPWIGGFYSTRLAADQAQQQREAITLLLRLFIPQVIFYGLAATTAGLLNAHKRFAVPTFTPILNNITVIGIFIIFYQTFGRVGLDASRGQLLLIGLGTSAGVIVMAAAQLPFVRGLIRYKLTLQWRHPAVRKVARLAIFVAGFVAVSNAGFVFVQWLSNEQQGGYSAYVTAYTFFLLPVSLFSVPITTALLPDMSRYAINEQWPEFRERLSLGMRTTLFLTVPAAAAYLILARPGLEFALSRGVITSSSVDLVSDVLKLFVLGLPQTAIFGLFVRAFYAMQDAKLPFAIVTATVAFNAVINVPLYAWLGVAGLALGQAIAYTAAIAGGGAALARRIGGVEARAVATATLRIVVATAPMSAMILLVWSQLGDSAEGLRGLLTLSAASGAGVVTYLIVGHLIGVKEVFYVRKLLYFGRGQSTPDMPPTLP